MSLKRRKEVAAQLATLLILLWIVGSMAMTFTGTWRSGIVFGVTGSHEGCHTIHLSDPIDTYDGIAGFTVSTNGTSWTATEIQCDVDGGTNAVITLYEANATTWADTGTDIEASITCTASGLLQTSSIDNPTTTGKIGMEIVSQSGTNTLLRVSICGADT